MKVIQVKVKPGARQSRIEEVSHGPWLAFVRSPPTDGKANAELVTLLAEHLDCPRSAITIKSGAGARLKLIQVDT